MDVIAPQDETDLQEMPIEQPQYITESAPPIPPEEPVLAETQTPENRIIIAPEPSTSAASKDVSTSTEDIELSAPEPSTSAASKDVSTRTEEIELSDSFMQTDLELRQLLQDSVDLHRLKEKVALLFFWLVPDMEGDPEDVERHLDNLIKIHQLDSAQGMSHSPWGSASQSQYLVKAVHL